MIGLFLLPKGRDGDVFIRFLALGPVPMHYIDLGCQAILPSRLPCWPSPGDGYSYNRWGWAHSDWDAGTLSTYSSVPFSLFQPVFTVCMCVFVGVILSLISPTLDHHLFLFSPSPTALNIPIPSTTHLLQQLIHLFLKAKLFNRFSFPSTPTSLSKITSRQLVSSLY